MKLSPKTATIATAMGMNATRAADFAPFKYSECGGNLIVAYAEQDSEKKDEVHGAGLGFVNIFSSGGKFLAPTSERRLVQCAWGIALAPEDFGEFSHSLLIGNFGSGTIMAFNPVTFQFRGFMKKSDNSPIVIDGLWSPGVRQFSECRTYNSVLLQVVTVPVPRVLLSASRTTRRFILNTAVKK